MSGTTWGASLSADEEWQPYGPPEEAVGQVRWLPQQGDAEAGVWTVQPEEVPPRSEVPAEHRELGYIIEGEVEVEVEGGPVLRLTAGDMLSIEPGQTTYWTILSPVRKFFVHIP